jgi:hypothetical protein
MFVQNQQKNTARLYGLKDIIGINTFRIPRRIPAADPPAFQPVRYGLYDIQR